VHELQNSTSEHQYVLSPEQQDTNAINCILIFDSVQQVSYDCLKFNLGTGIRPWIETFIENLQFSTPVYASVSNFSI
jgi:hypothetical protein